MKGIFNKRTVLFISLLALITVLGVGASGDAESTAEEGITVGFIYVGPKDDYGYNQAHAEGAAAIKNIPGVTVLEEELVPETVDVQKSMQSMIEIDGATLLFPTSFGYFNPHILEVAPDYPDVFFFHCGGLYQEGVHPENVGSYFGYIDEGQYLNGIAAAYATESDKLGFIAAKPIPQVLRNINAFTLGAQSVNPEITVTVIFTGNWSEPVAEANATNSLIDAGIDVITMHVDSPKVIVENAAKRDTYIAGYHANQSNLAPELYLTGAEWNWAGIYTSFVEDFMAGVSPGNFVRGGLKDGFVKTSPYGPALSDEAIAAIEAVKAEMLAGEFAIFAGPIVTNSGETVVEAGVELAQTDPILEEMGYLVDGVIGDTGF